jgi:hypothetical protein
LKKRWRGKLIDYRKLILLKNIQSWESLGYNCPGTKLKIKSYDYTIEK